MQGGQQRCRQHIGAMAGLGDQPLRQIAGAQVAERIRIERNPAIERIVGSWPGSFCATYSRDLGFTADEDFSAVIKQFMAEYLPG